MCDKAGVLKHQGGYRMSLSLPGESHPPYPIHTALGTVENLSSEGGALLTCGGGGRTILMSEVRANPKWQAI